MPVPKDLFLKCPSCGLPFTKTDRAFGIDCANDCARKAWLAAGGSAEAEALRQLVPEFDKLFDQPEEE